MPLTFYRRPVYNEEGAAVRLGARDRRRLTPLGAEDFEIVFVDDASRDEHPRRAVAAQGEMPALRVLRHARMPARAARCAPACWLPARRSWSPWTATARTIRPTPPALADRMAAAPAEVGHGRRQRRKPPGQLVEEDAPRKIANAVRGPCSTTAPRRRLRPEGLPPRRLPAPSLFRPHAPLPAGPDDRARARGGVRTVDATGRGPRGMSKYNNLRHGSGPRPADLSGCHVAEARPPAQARAPKPEIRPTAASGASTPMRTARLPEAR